MRVYSFIIAYSIRLHSNALHTNTNTMSYMSAPDILICYNEVNHNDRHIVTIIVELITVIEFKYALRANYLSKL